MLMLNVSNIDVFYGGFKALWDVSLAVNKGEFVSLIGSNGAGKTTTLNTIIGLLKPSNGEIVFKDVKISRLPPTKIVDLGLALVPESRAIFPYMTVEECLLVGAQIRRAWSRRMDSLEWVYQLFPRLRERRGQKAGTLSGGEQQMLNIGRALMSRPELLMLDEPSIGLAPKIVAQIFNTLKVINEEGVTILLTEQHIYHALKMSSRAYVIETGRIVLAGGGDELLNDKSIKEKYLGM